VPFTCRTPHFDMKRLAALVDVFMPTTALPPPLHSRG
jgi:hypothetical protein